MLYIYIYITYLYYIININIYIYIYYTESPVYSDGAPFFWPDNTNPLGFPDLPQLSFSTVSYIRSFGWLICLVSLFLRYPL